MPFICQALLDKCHAVPCCLRPCNECPISQMRMEGLAVQHLTHFLFGMNLLLYLVSVLLRGHRGSETFLCCPTWWSGLGQQGSGFATWGTKMAGKLDILSRGRSCGHEFWRWHFGAVPSSWNSWPEGPAKDCSSSTRLWFSVEFPSLTLQLLSILEARKICSVNSSLGWYSQSWCDSYNQKPWLICEETDSSVKELVQEAG